MGYPLKAGEVVQPHYRKTQDRIDLTTSVDVLNEALKAVKPLCTQKVQVAMFYVNKMLPSLQAVAVQLEERTSHNMSDLMLQAQQLGMSEADLFSTPETKALITQEKVDSLPDSAETPLPPDVAG